jgi:cytochrome oxidase Cu insertion factor (SCO1/SenC/PrrC family)
MSISGRLLRQWAGWPIHGIVSSYLGAAHDLLASIARDTDRGARMISEGTAAPDFELTADGGQQVKLSDFRGKPVVLYFYPKDDTLAR